MSESNANTQNDREKQTIGNPFPGLRPFSIDESHLFFGREGQSEEVLKKLAENRFVAVIGASGSGKSSLIYCGLIPILYGGFITQAGSRWKIITTRPGNDPIHNLAESFVNTQSGEVEDREVQISMTKAILHRSSMGLVECVKQLNLSEDENILILIDQFEELFRFKASREDHLTFNESEAFVKLLVEAVEQRETPVYVVLTMRSDFIGECSQFQELTEEINRSNYLVPQMTREDFRAAVEGPVAVGGAKIEKALVQQLLNEVGDDPDQLPILQHSLMRTWEYWEQLNDPDKPISLSDYEAIGKMEKALSEHANEAFDELNASGKRVCESMFKTLTEKGTDNRGIRHPTRVEVLASISKSSVEEVIEVAERFRSRDRSFLAPAPHIPLNKDSVLDLSHESLMRIWNKLKVWVEEEAQAIQMYTRLADASGMYQEGKTGLWRPPDLQLALNWRKKQQPTLTWAERYNPAFERAMVYLETSEKEYLAEEENKIRMQKRALRRTRITAVILGTAAIISLGFMLYAVIQQREAEKQRQIAEEQRTEATTQRSLAEQNAEQAREQQILAEQNAEEARRQEAAADSARIVAVENEQEATTQRNLAQANEARAVRNEQLATENAEEATRQKQAAEAASDEAYRNRLLSIAQAMSVKSLQVDQDLDLKSLLAYQAYQFNKEYGGFAHNADIYLGLYNALKVKNRESYIEFRGHDDNVNSIQFVPGSSEFYSVDSEGRLLHFDLNNPDRTFPVLSDSGTVVKDLAISSDGKWLACATWTGIRLYDLASRNTPMKRLTGHSGEVLTVNFIPGTNQLISSGSDRKLLLWDVNAATNTTIPNQQTTVQDLAVSHNGSMIAAATKEGKLLLWNHWTRNTDEPIVIYQEARNQVSSVCFSHDGSVLVSGDQQGNVKIWFIERRELIQTLRGHVALIEDVDYSPDDSQLASVGRDGTIQIWETKNLFDQPIVIKDSEGWVYSVAFSPDGKYFLTGSTGSLVARPTRSANMAVNMCSLIQRNFSKNEWDNYVGEDIPYVETCSITTASQSDNNE